MIEHLRRGQLLLQQGRHAQAEGELRLYLADRPEDGFAHALLSLCLTRQEKFDPAEEEARLAITLSPAVALGHHVHGVVLYERRRYEEAQRAIDEALRLDPTDGGLFALRGAIALQTYDWAGALQAAEQGLEIEPENVECINVQAQALIKLGRKAEATRSIAAALAQQPDNSYTHANNGWAKLHESKPKEALEHFREALRLDPENDWAKAGMVEALKARNIIYRLMLSWFLWMSRLSPRVRVGVILGGYFGAQFLRGLRDQMPAIAPFITPLIIAYSVFALMTWISNPLFNLLLRTNRYGRYALSDEQRLASTWFGICFATAIVGLTLGIACDFAPVLSLPGLVLFVTGLVAAGLLIPVSAIWSCDRGWPRNAMIAYTIGLGLFGLFALGGGPLLVVLGNRPRATADNLAQFFVLGVFASQFVAMGLSSARTTR